MPQMPKVHFKDLLAPVFDGVSDDVLRFGRAHYWLAGGRGSTKSSCISLCIALGMTAAQDRNAVILRKVARTIYDSVYMQMRWALDQIGALEYWRAYKSPMKLVHRKTGQEIIFVGADDPQKIKSIKPKSGYFAYAWYEELTEFSGMEEIRTINQSIVRGGNEVACFYSYNPPKSAQNWVNAEALVQHGNRIIHHGTYLDVPPEWLGDQFIAEAENLKP
jgi:PBSX family phage terminase large subunit